MILPSPHSRSFQPCAPHATAHPPTTAPPPKAGHWDQPWRRLGDFQPPLAPIGWAGQGGKGGKDARPRRLLPSAPPRRRRRAQRVVPGLLAGKGPAAAGRAESRCRGLWYAGRRRALGSAPPALGCEGAASSPCPEEGSVEKALEEQTGPSCGLLC